MIVFTYNIVKTLYTNQVMTRIFFFNITIKNNDTKGAK